MIYFSGKVIFTWFSCQCSEVENTFEYDQSHHDLRDFFNERKTWCNLSLSFQQAVVKLQENFRNKESKLANSIWLDCRNCMDIMTTSPIESCNHALKNSSHSVHSNMNLDTTCAKVVESVESRIRIEEKQLNGRWLPLIMHHVELQKIFW